MLIVLQSKIIWLLSRPLPTVLLLLAANLGQLQNTQDALQLPAEVKFKRGYINSNPAPSDFRSAMLWGIAIADTRVPGHESAVVEIASSQLSCRVDGKDVVLNDDGHRKFAEASTSGCPGSRLIDTNPSLSHIQATGRWSCA
jgi:hypothetical protein